MRFSPLVALIGAAVLIAVAIAPSSAQQSEKRIALVLGESAYAAAPLATAANDAGLVAQTLQAAGFDVVGARDLGTQGLRDALREFVEKAQQSGPDTVAMVYFAGYGMQSDGENFLAGVDAHIGAAADVAINAIRVNDFLRPLASVPLKARIVVLDAARKNPFAAAGQPLAGGLALMQPDDGTLIAFNAGPGTIGPDETGPYGVYARAMVEMIKDGGAPVKQMFERVRMRVSEATQGAQIPWDASRIGAPVMFFSHTAEAPAGEHDMFSKLASEPITSFSSHDAYLAAVARDTLEAYQEYLAAFPDDPLATRVRAMLAARREARIWRESCGVGTSRAYWTYLRRYPRGPHVYEARQALRHLAVAVEAPPDFEEIIFDVPPPPPEEIIYVERPVVYFADPLWAFAAPPPPPIAYFGPPPAWFATFPPPPPPVAAFVLPIPTYYPVAAWVAPPVYVAADPANIFAANLHNTVVVDPGANRVTVTNAAGQRLPALPANVAAPVAAGAIHPAIAAAAAAALPAAAIHALAPRGPAALAPGHALPTAPTAHAPTGAAGAASAIGGNARGAPGVASSGASLRPVNPNAAFSAQPNARRGTARPAAPGPGGAFLRPTMGHGAPRHAAPHFVAPRFAAPHAGPRFHGPGGGFGGHPGGAYFPGHAVAPRFAAPHAGPHFPGGGAVFSAPHGGPAFAGPRSAPHFAAPRGQPGGRRPAGHGDGGGKPHW